MKHERTERVCALLLLLAILAHTVLFSSLLIQRHSALVSHDPRDEATNNQILWWTSHGNPVFSTIKGTMYFHGHFRPVFFAAAIPWVAYPHAATWYATASLAIAASAIFVYRIGRRLFLSEWQGLLWSFAYLAFLPLNEINLGNYDPEILAVLPLAWGFDLYLRRRLGPFLLMAAATLACKENLGVVLAGYSLHALIVRRSWAWILLPGAFGLGWMLVCLKLIIPLYYPLHHFVYLRFLHEEANLSGLAPYVLGHPTEALGKIAWGEHLSLLWRLLRSGGYLGVFSPVTLVLALPVMALVFLQHLPVSVRQSHQLTGAVPFMFFASMLGARYVSDRVGRFLVMRRIGFRTAARGVAAYALLVMLASNFGTGIFGLGQNYRLPGTIPGSVSSIYDSRNFQQTEFSRRSWEAMQDIGESESVMTNSSFLLPLSERAMLWEIGTALRMPRPDVVLLNLTEKKCHGCTFNQILPGQLDVLADWIESGDYDALCVDQEIIFLRKSREPVSQRRGDMRAAVLLRAISSVEKQRIYSSLADQVQGGLDSLLGSRP